MITKHINRSPLLELEQIIQKCNVYLVIKNCTLWVGGDAQLLGVQFSFQTTCFAFITLCLFKTRSVGFVREYSQLK